MTDDVKFFLTIYGGVAAFAWILVLLDWLGRRQDRRSKQHKAA